MAKKIILIHGLGGTADGTWGKFPQLLHRDTDIDFEIISCGYESPPLYKVWLRAPSILNIANGILTDIKARCDIENDEIILAGHSLGGIILKKVLLILENKKISHKIVKVCFFDVPHDGSVFANIGKYFAFRNRHLKSLTRDSSELDDLNDQWISSELNSSLDILNIIAANDNIVSSSSSKSIFRGQEVETINAVNHSTIVKPDSTNSSSYIVFKNFILKQHALTKYKNSSSRDLNDWQSIERNHSYHFASDEERVKNLESLVRGLELDKAVIRLTGASGLGKTRLIFEAINESESTLDSNILVFNAPGYEKPIKESIRAMVDDRVFGLVIIENCSIDLHNDLAKEVNKTDCLLKLVSIGYTDEQVDESIHIKLLPLSNEAIKQILLPKLVGMGPSDVDRVAQFAQGYPLMATLIAEQYQKEGRLLGSIERSSVVRKLIDSDGDIKAEEKEILSACSLFDVFGTSEGNAGDEAKFIAEKVARSNQREFDRVIKTFTGRQIINRAGRYARLVPKPLALTLASEWWEETSYDHQKELIDSLPASLMHSFCTQASYLDDQPSVQRFSNRLFGGQSPFVHAEELLTERGSKLFRAFVEVNPESTSDAIYSLLVDYSYEQLEAIEGNTRRNLVWGLEKLCFHGDVFEKASWCLLLLASAENENWGNNATGIFAQLFRVHLSGTKAKPNIRFDVLIRAIKIDQSNIDMIILEALKQSISTHGATRTVGAEYQGTKATLEEWKPDTWQEVFDFWEQAFDLILVLLERGKVQREKILSGIGFSIRGFVANGRIEMMDKVIRKVISINGKYWPAALDSIKKSIEYDSDSMNKTATDALNSWFELLDPSTADLQDKLKILITNPSWEHQKDEDGDYVDLAAKNAKHLAIELSSNIEELFPHIDLLLVGQQKQAYPFGYQLALELADVKQLLDYSLEHLLALEHPNLNLILGIYHGIFEKSTELWQQSIERLLFNDKLIRYYPEFIRTGDVQKSHLDKLFELIEQGLLLPEVANVLSYGGVTSKVQADVIISFCLKLTEMGGKASWTALNVIYMYCFSKKGIINELSDQLKKLVTAVPLSKGQESTTSDVHHWQDMAKKLLEKHDEEFAVALTNQLIFASKYGFDHGDIWSYIKPFMLELMKDYSEVLWPIFGDAIIKSDGVERYWLQNLLDRETDFDKKKPSVLSVIPIESVIEWCMKQPDIGPVFVARCLNIFETVDGEEKPSELFISLLENFGNSQQVMDELSGNMASRGWSGSLVPYLESDKNVLISLMNHNNPNVRTWVKDQNRYIDRKIIEESNRDEELGFGLY